MATHVKADFQMQQSGEFKRKHEMHGCDCLSHVLQEVLPYYNFDLIIMYAMFTSLSSTSKVP